MPTFTTMSGTDSRGFSLLELMVIIALVGLVAAVVVPNLTTRDKDSLAGATDELRVQLSRLSERSLVRGELLAVRLRERSLETLRYDFQQGGFVPLDADAPVVKLPEHLALEWQLSEQEDDGSDLADTMESMVGDSDSKFSGRDDDSDTENDSMDEFPQLFFFPSGEATAVTLWVRDRDDDAEMALEVDSLGRVAPVDREDGEA